MYKIVFDILKKSTIFIDFTVMQFTVA